MGKCRHIHLEREPWHLADEHSTFERPSNSLIIWKALHQVRSTVLAFSTRSDVLPGAGGATPVSTELFCRAAQRTDDLGLPDGGHAPQHPLTALHLASCCDSVALREVHQSFSQTPVLMAHEMHLQEGAVPAASHRAP